MAITNLKVSNFKSFKDLDLNLGRFNVVIGANASGKSNFVEIFRFLRTIEKENLSDAISLHGGRDSMPNKKLGFSEPIRIRATSDRHMPWPGGWPNTQLQETIYDFCLQIVSPQDGILIKDDHFTQKLRTGIGSEDTEIQLDVLLSDGTRKVEIGPRELTDDLIKKKNESFVAFYKYVLGLLGGQAAGALRPEALETGKPQALLVRHGFLGLMGMERLFERLGIYDIDPQAVKRPHDKAGRISLQENGENLALVLRQILADPEKSRSFHNLLRDILPFAMEIGTEQYLGTSILLKLREEYYEDALLANLLSDGTVDIAALVTALFFEDKDVILIEEPERNIHPRLVSGLMELMKDASRNKQVIITTHSPEVVKHAGVENLLLISRDKEGFSTVSRPAEKEAVKVFLERDLGLDDLFVQELLAVP